MPSNQICLFIVKVREISLIMTNLKRKVPSEEARKAKVSSTLWRQSSCFVLQIITFVSQTLGLDFLGGLKGHNNMIATCIIAAT